MKRVEKVLETAKADQREVETWDQLRLPCTTVLVVTYRCVVPTLLYNGLPMAILPPTVWRRSRIVMKTKDTDSTLRLYWYCRCQVVTLFLIEGKLVALTQPLFGRRERLQDRGTFVSSLVTSSSLKLYQP